jgi:hypothetical protein
MVKALARAFRWRKLLETGVFATVEEIAAAEKINASYVLVSCIPALEASTNKIPGRRNHVTARRDYLGH